MEEAEIRKARRRALPAALGWIVGGFCLLFNLFALLAVQGAVAVKVLGALGVLASLMLLPPVVKWLRARSAIFRPTIMPPTAAFAVWLCGAVSSGIIAGGGAPTHPLGPALTPPPTDSPETLQREADYENPAGRPPLGRPLDALEKSVLSIDDPKKRARMALRAGKLSIAEGLVFGPTYSEGDPEWVAIKGQVEAAETADINPVVASDFPAKVTDQWLPEIAQAPASAPETVDEVWERERFFELMAENLDGDRQRDSAGNPTADPPKVASARAKLRSALAAKQAKVFPVLRAAFVKLTAQQMWLNDVAVTGGGARITYTAGMFAANANIAAAYVASESELRQLRFKRVDYDWCRGCGGSYYNLKSPSDGVVTVWTGGDFEPVR